MTDKDKVIHEIKPDKPTETIVEQIDLVPFMIMEFSMNKDHEKGALLRITGLEEGAPDPDLFTAPSVDYLFDIGGRLLLRLADIMQKTRTRNQLSGGLMVDLSDLARSVSSLFGVPVPDASSPRKES
jgi:hypothetical protein